MATTAKYVSFFSVAGDSDHRAYYDYRIDEVATGDPKVRIGEVVQIGYPPTGGEMPTQSSGHPDWNLDIQESRHRGYCTYAFQLNATVAGRQRLQFVSGLPFIALPLNSTGGDIFLTDEKMEYGSKGLWASFSCNLDDVQDSALASRIRAQADGKRPILTIPFCFNVIDPLLGASPWVVPNETSSANFSNRDILTHGGVHPAQMVSLNVELE
jgi:hypothetical protein